MIKEIIVVEGKQDIAAVRRAVDAECVATGGFSLPAYVLERLEYASVKRGLIILTDPDSAGERIRKFLAKRFPQAKHAFVPREEAIANHDIGVEQASAESIRAALAKVRQQEWESQTEFSWQDIIANDLTGVQSATMRRNQAGKLLGIGYANAKGFLYRLNNYGVTRSEFTAAMQAIKLQKAGEDEKQA